MTDKVTPPGATGGTAADPGRGEPTTAPHPTSIAVWGAPSPVVVNREFVAHVGVKCLAGCPLPGQPVVVRNDAGADVGRGRLGETPAPGTSALYATDVVLKAPAAEGIHTWTAAFDGDPATATSAVPADAGPPGEGVPALEAVRTHREDPGGDARRARRTGAPRGADTTGGTPPAYGALAGHGIAPAPDLTPSDATPPVHANATATFSFRTVQPPEHRVTVTVCDRDSEAPLAGADVRVGINRGTTDARGQAHIEVRAGNHDLYVRKAGYAPHNGGVAVSGDVTVRVAATQASDPDLDDDQIWM